MRQTGQGHAGNIPTRLLIDGQPGTGFKSPEAAEAWLRLTYTPERFAAFCRDTKSYGTRLNHPLYRGWLDAAHIRDVDLAKAPRKAVRQLMDEIPEALAAPAAAGAGKAKRRRKAKRKTNAAAAPKQPRSLAEETQMDARATE